VSDDFLADFQRDWDAGLRQLTTELEGASFDAATDGIRAAQESHPYTDRTGDLTGYATPAEDVQRGERGASMQWPMPYASFVDKGTSRSAAYPFVPLAMQVATTSLEANAERAADNIAALLSE
jgi:hypothetical protein